MEKEKSLGRSFGKAHRAQSKFLDELLKPYGLWHGQLFLLKHILSGGIKCHKELCRNHLIDKAAVSRTVSKLIDSGYLQKQQDPEDKRKSVLLLTEKSQKFSLILQELLDSFQKQALRDFTAEEQDRFFDYLERVAENLAKGEQSAK